MSLSKIVVGQSIKSISAGSIFQEPNTKDHQYEFEVELSNNELIYFTPYGITEKPSVDTHDLEFAVEVVDGPGPIEGLTISCLMERPMTQIAQPNDDDSQFALVLSDGRAVLNALKCGGGSSLHVEEFSNVERYMGGGWVKFDQP